MRRWLWGGMVLLLPLMALAGATLRVGSRVLTVGDTREQVVELLGKPSSKARRRGQTQRARPLGGVRVLDRHTMPAEQWRYRRGDRVTVITFMDGRVTDIDDRRW